MNTLNKLYALVLSLGMLKISAQPKLIQYTADRMHHFQYEASESFELAWLNADKSIQLLGTETLAASKSIWAFDYLNKTINIGGENLIMGLEPIDCQTALNWIFAYDTVNKKEYALAIRPYFLGKSLAIFCLEKQDNYIKGIYIEPKFVDSFQAPIYYSVSDSMSWGPIVYSEEDKRKILRSHNIERRLWYTGDLQWDNELEKYAASWAKHLAENYNGYLYHSNCNSQGYGENICQIPNFRITHDPLTAVNAFVMEKKNYHGQPLTKKDMDVFGYGHYTQMISKYSTHVGAAAYRCKHGDFVVFSYSPPGNWIGTKPY